ncbi:hypothetical protein LTR17_014324 [Elasticomyces elasticus]|nr:hypothetical protein LTR17_014324 [Elasticomyces elasticus]
MSRSTTARFRPALTVLATTGLTAVKTSQRSPRNASSDRSLWQSLGCKQEIAIILYVRLIEIVSQTGFNAILFHKLASFEPKVSADQVALQAGVVRAAFALGAATTAIAWGHLSQHPAIGKKGVMLGGVAIAAVGCAGIALAKTFEQVVFFEAICGISSGNVGVIRASIFDLVPDERFAMSVPSVSGLLNYAAELDSRLNHRPTPSRHVECSARGLGTGIVKPPQQLSVGKRQADRHPHDSQRGALRDHCTSCLRWTAQHTSRTSTSIPAFTKGGPGARSKDK